MDWIVVLWLVVAGLYGYGIYGVIVITRILRDIELHVRREPSDTAR